MPELAYSNAAANVERIMPQDVDAEKAVLAAMLLGDSGEVVDEAFMKLSKDDFYRPAHRKIFEAMQALYEKEIPIDQLSLADMLKTRGQLEAVGGKAYIVELGNNSYALANWSHHADIVKRDAFLRNLIGAAAHITALGYDAPDDLDEVVEESEKTLFDVTNRRVGTNFQSMDSLVMGAFEEVHELSQSKQLYQGVRTGFKALDDLIGGMRGGDLVILAARPSVGKTALALNIARRAAYYGASVAFFSLEMSAQQLVQRVIASEAEIDSKHLQTGRLNEEEWRSLATAASNLSKLDFWVDDTPSASILEVRAKARRQLRHVKDEQGLIVVDYLQLMQPQNTRTESRQVEIAEISRGLKILAKEMNVPIIALSQLSRAVESRQDKRPVLSDLRESGAIEQDADIVMFLDRSKDEREAECEGRPPFGEADVIVAKHRNGPLGTVKLTFDQSSTRFYSWAGENEANR